MDIIPAAIDYDMEGGSIGGEICSWKDMVSPLTSETSWANYAKTRHSASEQLSHPRAAGRNTLVDFGQRKY
jgi:hypothetical protein